MKPSVEEYFQLIPSERIERFKLIHELIIKMYPKATVDMSYKMPTYKFDEGWVALANKKNYISLYTCSEYHIQIFKLKYPKIKTGKGCINIKNDDKFDLSDLEDVIKHAIEHPKATKF